MQNLSKEKYINYLLVLLIILHFLIGFISQENAGGGKIDEIHILKNFFLFSSNSFFQINWLEYESSSLPLIYIIYNFLIDVNNYSHIKNLNLFVSFGCFVFFYKSLVLVFKNLSKDEILLLASCLLLSPYFRTSTFFVLEENLAILFIIIGLFFFLKLRSSNFQKSTCLVLCLLFLSLSIYSRSNYVIIYIIIFFLIFDFKLLFCKNNLLTLALSILLSLPGFFILYKWGSILPPLAQDRLSVEARLPIILNIILIYTIPFFILEFNKIKKIFFSRKLFFFFIFFPIYYYLFHNIEVNYFGSGAINKLLFVIFNETQVQKLTIIISYFSLIIIYYLFFQNYAILSFVILNSFLFSTLEFIFQEYFDPITIIMFLLFGNFSIFKQKKNKYFLITYCYFFLISAILFQTKLGY